MGLTPNQLAAVNHPENIFLDSCPGSGKTRTIIAKLLRCLEEVQGTPRRIACITYTNAAVHEILDRLRTQGSSRFEETAEVATIHAFCLNTILHYHSWRIPLLRNGFEIVTPDDQAHRDAIQFVRRKYGFSSKEAEKFSLVSRGIDGEPLFPQGTTVPVEAFREFWKILENNHQLDFSSLIYYSYCIVRDHPQVVSAIVGEFAWFLVDEFQDTTQVQLEIFRLLHANGNSKFFLVGDPNQSIYAFAGARPDLIYRFVKEIAAHCDYQLKENWRSSEAVINDAERIRKRNPPMVKVDIPDRPEVPTEYVNAATFAEGIIDHFIPALRSKSISLGKAAVLAPAWYPLFPLARDLRAAGIHCIGPGSRPYKRSHLIALFLEDICGYLAKREDRLISQLERELFYLVHNASGKMNFKAYGFSGRVLIFELILIARDLARKNPQAIDWIGAFAPELYSALVRHGFLSASSEKLILDSAAQISDEIRENVNGGYTISDLGFFSNPDESLRLLTIHAAKGREFDAVALGGLHEGLMPFGGPRADANEIAESARKLYVGITRAKQMILYITDRSKDYNKPTRYLGAGYLGKT